MHDKVVDNPATAQLSIWRGEPIRGETGSGAGDLRGDIVRQISIAAVCAASMVVTACAGDKQVDLDPKIMSTVRHITLVGPADPVPLAVVTQNELNAQQAVTAAAAIPFAGVLGAALAGGVAGAISAEVARETSKPLNDAAAAEKYSYAADFQGALSTALKASGYDVSTATVDHKAMGFAAKLDGVGGDLIVDAVASATCTDVHAGKGNAHFRPVINVQVKLTRPGEITPVMNKSFLYDDAIVASDAFRIKGDPHYDVADYATLKGDIKACLAGIKASATPLANAVIAVVAAQNAPAAPPAAPAVASK